MKIHVFSQASTTPNGHGPLPGGVDRHGRLVEHVAGPGLVVECVYEKRGTRICIILSPTSIVTYSNIEPLEALKMFV